MTSYRLLDLDLGTAAFVVSVEPGRFGVLFLTRLEAMGLVPDREVRVLRRAWLGGPLVVRVGMTTEVAIRRNEAQLVIVRQQAVAPLPPGEEPEA